MVQLSAFFMQSFLFDLLAEKKVRGKRALHSAQALRGSCAPRAKCGDQARGIEWPLSHLRKPDQEAAQRKRGEGAKREREGNLTNACSSPNADWRGLG